MDYIAVFLSGAVVGALLKHLMSPVVPRLAVWEDCKEGGRTR